MQKIIDWQTERSIMKNVPNTYRKNSEPIDRASATNGLLQLGGIRMAVSKSYAAVMSGWKVVVAGCAKHSDDLDFATLSGDMNLEASKGQFVKLNPGATGRLLGLISLQGIPRRLSLDFNDVFSDGFAFDSIGSKMSVQNGVMHTDRLQIDGPAARVVMHGEVDLKQETQHLNVNVQPELGGTAALGMAIVNPVAGAATWVASKLLRNPLGQILSYNYLVTGSWVRRTLGFLLPESGDPRPPSAFGHPGMGGSIGFADPHNQLAMGYVMNKMITGPDSRWSDLCRAVYASLDIAPSE